jgi:hypothetical protein
MKHVLIVLAVGAIALTGCKKDSNNPITPAMPPPAANVTFTMHLESGTQGMIFVASPSVDVTITRVDISFPAQQFTDTVVNPNPEAVISKGSNVQINEYIGVAGGQRWVLVFTGKIAATGQLYTVTVNWDVV